MKNKLRLRRALKNVLDTKQNTVDEIPGLLGTLRNGKKRVKVNGRKGFVYVRLHGKLTETVQAYNDQVLQLYDMPVLVKRVYGKGYHYYVTGKDTGKYENWGGNNAQAQYAQHGNQHSFGIGAGGSDVVWVFKKQFMPLLLYPYSGTAVRVTEDWYQWGDVYKHFTGSVVELGGAKPLFIGDARFVTLYMDGDSNTVKGVTGSLFTSTPLPADITPYINVPTPSQGIPLSAVLLTSDTVNIAWNNIYDDIRPIYSAGGVSIYDDSVLKTVSSAISFDEGLQVSASGTVSYISTKIREKLFANRTYYVRTDGNDSNTGLVDSAAGAFLTIQKAVDTIANTLDIAGKTATIQVGDGTYTGVVTLKNVVGYASVGNLVIQGNSGTPANVVISTTTTCITANGISSVWRIKDMKLTSSSNWHGCLWAINSTIYFNNIDFGSAHYVQLLVGGGGASIICDGNYTISGNSMYHWYIEHGTGDVAAVTVTLSGTRTFSGKFILCRKAGTFTQKSSTTYSGNATGTRYEVALNGVIDSGGVAFPGDVDGSTQTGGQYI